MTEEERIERDKKEQFKQKVAKLSAMFAGKKAERDAQENENNKGEKSVKIEETN